MAWATEDYSTVDKIGLPLNLRCGFKVGFKAVKFILNVCGVRAARAVTRYNKLAEIDEARIRTVACKRFYSMIISKLWQTWLQRLIFVCFAYFNSLTHCPRISSLRDLVPVSCEETLRVPR